MINAGALRHRVQILKPSTQKDALGQRVEAFTPIDEPSTVAASVKNLSGRELERAKQVVAEATHEVIVRYRSGITKSHRISFKGRTIAIGHVDNVEELNQLLRMTCSEVS